MEPQGEREDEGGHVEQVESCHGRDQTEHAGLHEESREDRPLRPEPTRDHTRAKEPEGIAEGNKGEDAGGPCVGNPELILHERQDRREEGPPAEIDKPEKPDEEQKGETLSLQGTEFLHGVQSTSGRRKKQRPEFPDFLSEQDFRVPLLPAAPEGIGCRVSASHRCESPGGPEKNR
jgi:hypothetical protein